VRSSRSWRIQSLLLNVQPFCASVNFLATTFCYCLCCGPQTFSVSWVPISVQGKAKQGRLASKLRYMCALPRIHPQTKVQSLKPLSAFCLQERRYKKGDRSCQILSVIFTSTLFHSGDETCKTHLDFDLTFLRGEWGIERNGESWYVRGNLDCAQPDLVYFFRTVVFTQLDVQKTGQVDKIVEMQTVNSHWKCVAFKGGRPACH